MKCPKKWYFLFYECAIYRIKSKVAYLGQFFADLDEIWYKSRATQVVSTHQISSWSDEKWQRYGTCSVSQGRRGPSNWVSKMNLLKAGGHSFWPRKLIFGYVVAQCIYPKSYYYSLLIKSSVWSRQGPKYDQYVPKYRVRLYKTSHLVESWIEKQIILRMFLYNTVNEYKLLNHILSRSTAPCSKPQQAQTKEIILLGGPKPLLSCVI